MKLKLLAVGALAPLCFLSPAHADTFTTFDVSAPLVATGLPCNSCALTGTITIDITTGMVTASTVTAPGTSIPGPYNQNISNSPSPIPGVTHISLLDSLNDEINLNLPVSSLVNYAGGPICVGQASCAGGGQFAADTFIDPGQPHPAGTSVVATSGMLSVAVPGPIAGAGLPGLILAGGGFFGWWRLSHRRLNQDRCR